MEIEIRKEKKKIISRIFLIIGAAALILGFSPWFFSYKVGLIIFIYSLVFMYAIRVAVLDAEINKPTESEIAPKEEK